MFKDMHNNQMSVIMLVDGFPNKEYVLKNGNNQTILLEFENNQWKNRDLQSLSDKVINTLKEKKMILIGSLVLLLLFISWIYFRKKIRIKNEKL